MRKVSFSLSLFLPLQKLNQLLAKKFFAFLHSGDFPLWRFSKRSVGGGGRGRRTTRRCIFKTLEVELTDHRAFYRPTLLPGDKRSTFHTRRCPQRPSDSSSQGKLCPSTETQIELGLVWLQLRRRLLNLLPTPKPAGGVMESM